MQSALGVPRLRYDAPRQPALIGARERGFDVAFCVLPREGQSPVDSYEGDGYVIVRHQNTDVVEHALKDIVQTIRVELG